MAEMLAKKWVNGENSPHAKLCCRRLMGRKAGVTNQVQQQVGGEDGCRERRRTFRGDQEMPSAISCNCVNSLLSYFGLWPRFSKAIL